MKQDLIHRESARRIIESPRSKEQMLAVLEGLPPVEAELAKDSPKVENSSGDSIYRQAAIDVIFSEPLYETGMEKRSAEEVVPAIFEKIKALPPAQSQVLTCDGCRHVGTYDTDFPCSGCIRREKDYYEQER